MNILNGLNFYWRKENCFHCKLLLYLSESPGLVNRKLQNIEISYTYSKTELHVIMCSDIDITEMIYNSVPKSFFFLQNLFGFDKNHRCSHRNRASGWQASKTRNLYLRNNFRLLRIHKSSIREKAPHNLRANNIFVAGFMGIGRFLFRYSNGRTKSTLRQLQKFPDYFNKTLFLLLRKIS